MKNKRSSISWGDDPRKMTEDDLLPCPKCGSNAGRATKRATVFTNFLGMWKVSCQRHECPLAMIYFHPVEWNELPRISQREYDELQAEIEKLTGKGWKAKGLVCLSDYEALQHELEMYKWAFNEWLEKSKWVQERVVPEELGMHRADVMKSRIEALQAECEKLRSELDAHKAARIAYASEFPPDEDGQPDVGSIHQNIRKLKEEVRSGVRSGGCQSAGPRNDDARPPTER